MPKYVSFQHACQDNTTRICKVKGCELHRKAVSGYCNYHTSRLTLHGDPEHRCIRYSEYKGKADQVKAILQKNISHPGVKQGLSFFKDWLSDPEHPRRPQKQVDFVFNIRDMGVSERDLLSDATALFMMKMENHYKIRSQRHFIYQLGHTFILHAPLGGVIPRGTTKREYGQHIYDNLYKLFLNITASIREKLREDEERKNAFMKPLDMSTEE